MIDFVRGRVAHRETDYVVIDVGGVGYRVFCPNPHAIGKDGNETIVYTHHHVREDAMLLYGFASREEQAMFRTLLDVNGIGPRVALGILSAGEPAAIVSSIRQENIAYLTKLPGIGKKTAQRIILDLKDKLGSAESAYAQAAAGARLSPSAAAEAGNAWPEAREGLLALGYSEVEIERIHADLRPQIAAEDTADILIRKALKSLFKP